jgi:tetratricopeptide (TPR) repeat protein
MERNLSVPIDEPVHPLYNTVESLLSGEQTDSDIKQIVNDLVYTDIASWQVNIYGENGYPAEIVRRQTDFLISQMNSYILPKLLEFVKRYPQDPRLHSILGYAFQMVGRYACAVKEYLLAIEYSDKTTNIHFLLAQLCWTMANEKYNVKKQRSMFRFYCEMALRSIEKILLEEWNNTDALVLKGLILGSDVMGRLEDGIQAIATACRIEPDNFWNYWEIAGLYEKSGDIKKAFFAYTRAKDLSEDEPELIEMAEEKISSLKRSFKNPMSKRKGKKSSVLERRKKK